MPVLLDDILAQSDAALSAAETLYVRQVIREESTVTVPSDGDVTTALAALDEAGRQHLRAQLAEYKSGQILIDGGQDAMTYDVALERWGVRNAVRLLLGFAAEPRPANLAGQDVMQFVSIQLSNYGTTDEWS